ncbi:MAG: YadA-like family protein [Alphaproteobacteria bacterium]|nr:YadA-like family protein [Alphaproteobacteria bacterium]
MKYSNTAITQLTRLYKSILVKCAIFNAAILMSSAFVVAPAMADQTVITDNATLSGEYKDSTANDDGGVFFVNAEGKTVEINSSKFTGNSVTGNDATGGAISLRRGTLNIDNTVFTGNTAPYSGAIFTYSSGNKLKITNSQFNSNVALGAGALQAMFETEIKDTSFTGNRATEDSDGAGALFVGAVGKTKLDNVTFTNNTSATRGGAISTRSADVADNSEAKIDILGSTFTGNTAGTTGGAIDNYMYSSVEDATAVYIDDTTFTNNTANKGGAIYNHGQTDKAGKTSSLKIVNSTFTGNGVDATSGDVVAQYGGAIYNEAHASMSIEGTFTGNKAVRGGGAIYNKGIITVKNSLFDSNEDAAIYNDRGNITLTDTSFTNNTGENGGAILNWGAGSVLTINAKNSDVTFSGNTATEDADAGDIASNKGTIYLNAANGKTISMSGGINGWSSASNQHLYINSEDGSTGTVDISGSLKNHTVSVERGELHLSNGVADGSNVDGSIINVVNGAVINTIDDVVNDYSSNINLADGAKVKGDVDFENSVADKYAATSGTIKYMVANLIGAAANGSKTIQVAGEGSTINISEAKFNIENGLTFESSGSADGKMIVNGMSGGIEDAADASSNVENVDYDFKADESVDNNKEFHHTVTVNGDGTSVLTLNADLGTAAGATTTYNKMNFAGTGSLNNNGTLHINDSDVAVDVNNYGRLISDPTSYSGTVTNEAGAYASFDADTFTTTAELANSGDAYLKNNVQFQGNAKITGNGDLYLMSGTTAFNNTKNSNDAYLASGAKFSGTLIGGSLDTQNGAIDTSLGTIQDADLYMDAKLSGTGSADAFTGTDGSTIKEITILGNDYNPTKDELKIAVGTATLDDDVVINGANYYTKVEKDAEGNLVFSDKLINTSTIRGTDATGETVTIADKAETTNIGTNNAKIALSDSAETATVTAANGLIISDGTNNATLKATTTGLDVAQGLTVGGTAYGINSTGVGKFNGFTVGSTSYGIDNTGAGTLASLTVGGYEALTTDSALNGAKLTPGTVAKTALASGVQTTLTNADTLYTNLGGVTATAAELNVLDGITASTDELNYMDGVTSNVQAQLDAKQGTLTAGNGIDITSNKVSVVANTDGTIVVDTDGVKVGTIQTANIAKNAVTTGKIADGAVNSDKLSTGVKNNMLMNATSSDGLTITGGNGSTKANIALKLASTGGLEEDATNGLQIQAGGVQLSMINGAAMTSAAVDTGSTGTKLVNETSLGATRGAIETKLAAGATGYDIDAKTLKVAGKNVLSEADVAPDYAGTTKAEADAYVLANADKFTNIGSTAGVINTIFKDKQDWINDEFGYNTATKDANTLLTAAGYADQNGDDNVGFYDALAQLNGADTLAGSVKNSIKTLAASANYDKTTSGLTATTIQGAIDEIDGNVDDVSAIVGDAQTTAATTGQFKDKKIGADINLVNAVDELGRNMVSLGADNIFTGANIFKNASGIAIQDAFGSNQVTLKATADGLEVDKAIFAKNGVKMGSNTVTSIDTDGTTVKSAATAANVMATSATVYNGAENGLYDGVKVKGDTTATHTIKTAIGATNNALNALTTTAGNEVDSAKVDVQWNSTDSTLATVLGNGVYSSTNYVAAGDSVTTAVSKLDGQVKTNADDIADINTAITVTADGTYIKAANDVKANLSALDTQVKTNADDIADINAEISTYGTIVTKDAAPAFTGSTLADVNAYVAANGANVADVNTTAGLVTAVLYDKEAWIGDQLGFNPKTTDANTVLSGEGFTDKDSSGEVSFNDAVVQLKDDITVASAGTYIAAGENVASNLSALDTQVKKNADDIATNAVIGTASASSAGYAATATVKEAVVAIDAALKVDEGNIATNTTNIGTLTSLTTDAKGNLVAAINEVDAHADAVQTEVDNIETALGVVNADGTYKASALNNNMFESGGTAASSLDGALLNLATNTTSMTGASIDDSGNLKVNYTSNNYVVDDTNLVASVSALDGALGAKVTGTNGNVLNTNSVNANLDKIDVNMGNLASLATTSSSGKASLVGAVNEVVSDITVAAGTYNVIHAGANVAQNLIDLDAVVGGADAKITSIGDSIGGTWSGNTFTHSNYNSAQNNILNTDNLTTAIGKLDTVIGDADSIVVAGYTGTEVVGAINKLNTNMTDGSLDAKFKSVTIDKAYAITGTTTGELDMGGNALKNVKGLELKDSTGTKSVALTVDGTTNDLVVNQGLKAASLESLGDLTVAGDASIAGDLSVTNDATIGNDLTVTRDASVGRDLTVGRNLTVTGDITADDATFTTLKVGSANALSSTVANQLDMGANNLVNIASITTTGNATVGGDLGVTGTSNLHDTNVQGNLTLKNATDSTKTVAMDVRRITVGSDNNDVVQVNGGMLSTNVIASTNGFKVLNSTSADKYTEVFDIDDHGSITSDVFSTDNTAAGNTVTIGKADNSTATTVKGTLEVTGATQLDSTLTADGESKFGKDTSGVYSLDVTDSAVTANKVVEATAGVKFGTDTTAMTGVSRANLSSVVDHTTNDSVIASAAAVQETRKDIEDKAHAVLGDVYKIDSTTRAVSYDNAALEATTPNGFETGATDLTDALTKYADNVMAAMGTTYAANGTYTNGFAKPAAVDYDGLATNQTLVAAISQLDKNIGTAITGTDRSNAAFDTSATNTVNENIAALDAVIGADVTKEYNGVVNTNSINQNIDAISTTLGRMDNLSTAAQTAGNAVVVRGNLTNANNTPLTADLTVADALSNLDKTLGRIHGLYDGTKVNVTDASYPSVTGANSNLAKGTTVENHLVSLDNAIGSRNIASLNTDINKAVNGDATATAGTEAYNGSLALGLQSVGDQMGDMNFTSTHYVAAGDNLSGAVRTLDSNLYRVEEDLRDLRRDFNNGMASMSAMSALVPNPRAAGNTSLSVGTGAYNGRTAVAVGGFHHINDNIMLNAGAAWGNASDVAYRLGITWSW